MREIFLMKSRRSKFMTCPVVNESFRQMYRMGTHLRKASRHRRGNMKVETLRFMNGEDGN